MPEAEEPKQWSHPICHGRTTDEYQTQNTTWTSESLLALLGVNFTVEDDSDGNDLNDDKSSRQFDCRTDSTGIAELKAEGVTISDPTGKAEALNNQFKSAFTTETQILDHILPDTAPYMQICLTLYSQFKVLWRCFPISSHTKHQDQMASLLVSSNSCPTQSPPFCVTSITYRMKSVRYQMTGERQMLYPSTRRVIGQILRTIAQYPWRALSANSWSMC